MPLYAHSSNFDRINRGLSQQSHAFLLSAQVYILRTGGSVNTRDETWKKIPSPHRTNVSRRLGKQNIAYPLSNAWLQVWTRRRWRVHTYTSATTTRISRPGFLLLWGEVLRVLFFYLLLYSLFSSTLCFFPSFTLPVDVCLLATRHSFFEKAT